MNDQLRADYGTRRIRYEDLCREMVREIGRLIIAERVALAVPIEWRVKDIESVMDKATRMPGRFKTAADMRDLAGLRIVLLFRRDVGRVADLLRAHFEVLYVEDTQERLQADRFGYSSLHFEIQPKAEWLSVPSWRHLGDLSAEVQVRTASQHIWAASSHVLQYKREAHAPVHVRRAINRVAALLELVDLELERVLAEREGYQAEAAATPAETANADLNVDNLRQVLHRALPAANASHGDDDMLAELLDECEEFNVITPKALEELLTKHRVRIRRAEEKALANIKVQREQGKVPPGDASERVDKGVFFTYVGLARQALKEEFGTKYENYLAGKHTKRSPS